jgi:hypothetical protein
MRSPTRPRIASRSACAMANSSVIQPISGSLVGVVIPGRHGEPSCSEGVTSFTAVVPVGLSIDVDIRLSIWNKRLSGLGGMRLPRTPRARTARSASSAISSGDAVRAGWAGWRVVVLAIVSSSLKVLASARAVHTAPGTLMRLLHHFILAHVP